MLRCNYHTHTVMCDGSDTPEDVVREAIATSESQYAPAARERIDAILSR